MGLFIFFIFVGVLVFLYFRYKKPNSSQSPALKNFDFESPRLIQIIQESIEIINKTKNPQTAARRFDDIKRTSQRLYEILPEGKKITYEINGRKIAGGQDLYILDEEKAKWMVKYHGKGGVGPPELIAAARGNHAEQISKATLPITGASDEAKDKVRQIIADNAAKGANPKEIYSKVAKELTSFDWPEFDKWLEIFRKAGEWPALWDNIAEYYIAVEHEPVGELLYRLKKDDLLRLADTKELKLKKTLKKEAIIAEITAVISEDDKPVVLQSIWPDGEKSLHKAKSALLAHTQSMEHSVEELKQQYNQPGEQIEIGPAPDCCSWCAKYAGKKLRVATLTKNQLPPFHPGCRCGVMPVVD